jgi:hypothetical protein
MSLRLAVGGSGWTGATIKVTNSGGTTIHTASLSGSPSGGLYTFPALDISGLPDDDYIVSGTGTVGGCSVASSEISVTLDTVVCGVAYDVGTASLSPTSGQQANRRKELNFRLETSCPGTAVDIDALSLTFSGGPNPSAYITKIQYNGVDVTSTLDATSGGNGVTIPLNTTITIPASGTSNLFKVFYSAQMSDGGSTRATWSSIQARLDNSGAMDETLESGTIQP